MESAFEFAPAIALFPLAAFVIALLFGRRLPKRGALVGIVATGASLVFSLWAALAVATVGSHREPLFEWAVGEPTSETGVEGIEFTFGILLDPLSTLMLVIVSLIALLVHVFSLG